MSQWDAEKARRLLCALGDHIRGEVMRRRATLTTEELAGVVAHTEADAIYGIDRISESAIGEWFRRSWPSAWPVELVMEGGPEGGAGALTFPDGTPPSATLLKAIIDPVDGTRGIMYDKRPAWVLAGLAPQKGVRTGLRDIGVAAMTEIPVMKQTRVDQISTVRGKGRTGIVAQRLDLDSGRCAPLALAPSRATDFRHGFAALVRFFPEGKALTAKIEEELWDELYGLGSTRAPLIFDDQYISTGGQFYELLAGRDRMLGDLRPLVLRKLGLEQSLTCHPYDVAAALILEEAGIVFEHPEGGPVDVPLDTLSPVAWIGFANPGLADQARPIVHRLIAEYLSP